MSVKELREKAKELGIVGRWDMNKDQLIEACKKAENETEKVENKPDDKMNRIDVAPIGTLVAVRLESGKVKSAKIVNRNLAEKKLKLETSYGEQFVVGYSQIVWIKTGTRWPNGVYKELRGEC